ncbi:MAG: hypothetical protein J5379_08510 [Clostridiales bacterium]|nr:hypothetical protein [Clostridiales bacterium]
MSEEKRRRLFRRVLILSGVILAAIFTCIVVFSSLSARDKMVSSIDTSMQRRAEKIKELNNARADDFSSYMFAAVLSYYDEDGSFAVFSSLASDEQYIVSFPVEEDQNGDPDMTVALDKEGNPEVTVTLDKDGNPEVEINQVKVEGETGGDDTSFLARTEKAPAYGTPVSFITDLDEPRFLTDYSKVTYYDDDGEGVFDLWAASIVDFDGDTISAVGDRFFIAPGGLFYSEQIEVEYYDSLIIEYNALNHESATNTQLFSAGKEIMDSGRTSGWEDDYRFYCFSEDIYAKVDKENYVDYAYALDPESYGENLSSAYSKTLEDNGYSLYTVRSVFFYDASGEMSLLRKHILWNSMAALLCVALMLAILAGLLYPLIRSEEEKNDTDEEKPQEFLSEEMANEFLAGVNRTEESMGPNGYLDELREIVHRHMQKNSDQQAKEESDPEADPKE